MLFRSYVGSYLPSGERLHVVEVNVQWWRYAHVLYSPNKNTTWPRATLREWMYARAPAMLRWLHIAPPTHQWEIGPMLGFKLPQRDKLFIFLPWLSTRRLSSASRVSCAAGGSVHYCQWEFHACIMHPLKHGNGSQLHTQLVRIYMRT